ncbi:MAG: hypothetical protein BAJATHORv1_20603 [Candidatus Thorarchaeota archaeon]|nr:MAG: hypothetical protein BAJATHORv1_20603 [Candidatus Thorarchaeota archaeon]
MTLSVAIPDTSLADCSGLREKTLKVGTIARALAVFRVDTVYIYTSGWLEDSDRRDPILLMRLLQYMDTPQYLRKRVFPHSPSLRYAGMLPPLRTRSHPLNEDNTLEVGEVRWGIQVRPGKIDIGLNELIRYPPTVSEKVPTLFRVEEVSPLHLSELEREDVERYWGFAVEQLQDLIRHLKDSIGVTRIAMSRNAPVYSHLEAGLKSTVSATGNVLVVFGGPHKGVSELFESEKSSLKNNIDFWVNVVPNQGTSSVRLEEAIFAGLALLNNSIGPLVARSGFY